MHNSNFSYLEKEFPILFNIGSAAEYYLYSDPIVSITKIRLLSEKITELIFEKHQLDFPREQHDKKLKVHLSQLQSGLLTKAFRRETG